MSFNNSTFLPLAGGGHFAAFGYGGTGFPVVQDADVATTDTIAIDEGVRRSDAAPMGAYGAFPPYDGYMGPHIPGVCGMPGGFGGYDPCPPLSVPMMWAMRATPAIVLASFYLTFAPAVSAPWSQEIEDDGGDADLAETVKQAATQDLLPMWQRAFPPSLESLHFGNWLQELVWGRRQDRGDVGSTERGTTVAGGYRVMPIDVRPVLPMEAMLHRDEFLRFRGFQIGSEFRSPAYAFLAVNQPHLDSVRGYSRNQNAIKDWWRAIQSERNADRIERKASGIHMMLGVPTGAMQFTKPDGTKESINPVEMAQRIADQASRANVFTVPRSFFSKDDIRANPDLADVKAVTVDRFDWGNIGEALTAHLKRLDRLDVNMVRAWFHGEREGMEAEHGSRADATAHKSGGVLDCESVRAMLGQQWDDQVVTTWQRQNFPQWQGRLRTKPAPLADPMQAFLQTVATTLLGSTATGPDTEIELDKRALLERTSLPLRPEDDVKKDRDQRAKDAKDAKDQQNKFSQTPINGVPANGNPLLKRRELQTIRDISKLRRK